VANLDQMYYRLSKYLYDADHYANYDHEGSLVMSFEEDLENDVLTSNELMCALLDAVEHDDLEFFLKLRTRALRLATTMFLRRQAEVHQSDLEGFDVSYAIMPSDTAARLRGNLPSPSARDPWPETVDYERRQYYG
jgi:hypothetical protein